MLQTGMAIYTNNDWDFTIPYRYIDGKWVPIIIHQYTNNNWEIANGAGTLMLKFITSNGDELMTSNGKYFLVRMP